LLRDAGRDFGFNEYLAPEGIDPREIGQFCEPDLQIPGYDFLSQNPSLPLPSLALDFDLPYLIAPGPQPDRCGPWVPRPIHFQVKEWVSDCAALNLRNTVVFLAVLAFVEDTGGQFHHLSPSGIGASMRMAGSAFAKELSRAERKLRVELFEPMKKKDAKDFRASLWLGRAWRPQIQTSVTEAGVRF